MLSITTSHENFASLVLHRYFASIYSEVVIGRFIVGVGVAVSGVADVSYLHECSPIEWRGSIVSVNEACISLGFLLAYIAGYVYADDGAEEWRIIFGMAGVLATIQFIGMFLHFSIRNNVSKLFSKSLFILILTPIFFA